VEFSGEGLAPSFNDVTELAAGCRFKDCSHSGEPGCAVAAAVEAGTLAPERLSSYHKLLRETQRHEQRNDLKKRLEAKRRLKSFGRLVRDIGEDKRRLRGGRFLFFGALAGFREKGGNAKLGLAEQLRQGSVYVQLPVRGAFYDVIHAR
jgi:hypothetical protein